MKIYTAELDFNRPMQKTITVPTNTEYKIGISATKNGEILELTEDDVVIQIGENEIAATGTYNGFVTFDYSQGRTPATDNAKVKITIDGKTTPFDLMIVGKYSTKGDISVGGAGDVTKEEFEEFKGQTETAVRGLNEQLSATDELLGTVSNTVGQQGEDINSLRINQDQMGTGISYLKDSVTEIYTELGNMYSNDEIDDKINEFAAHYLTKRTGEEGSYSYPQFATHADLASAKAAHTDENPQFFYGTEAHTPDKNDYCIVLKDETHDNKTSRYSFVGEWDDNGYFRYQYTINDTALTQEQWDAINSGVTESKLTTIESKVENIPTKMSQLTNDAGYVQGDNVQFTTLTVDEELYINPDGVFNLEGDPINIGVSDEHIGDVAQERISDEHIGDVAQERISDEHIEDVARSIAEGKINEILYVGFSGEYEDGESFSFDVLVK